MATAIPRLILCAVLAVLVAGCSGWHLRGQGPNKPNFSRVYIDAADAYNVGVAVQRELYNRNMTLVLSPVGADLVVKIEGERFDRRILSVDPETGKVREIELGLEAYYSVRTGDGRLLVPREPLNWQLDYVFDEISLLGTVAQDQTVQLDLAKIAATTLVLRLQTVQIPPAPPAPAAVSARELSRAQAAAAAPPAP